MTVYRCPVCRKVLSQSEYERALGILGERERHLQHQKAELQNRLRQAKAREAHAREQGVRTERARTQRLMAGKDKQIQTLKERVQHLQKGSTPQTEGLEFEEKLAARLQKEFRDDLIEHKGKAGDVLQHVRLDGQVAGLIVYECKRTPRIQGSHVRQASAAKQARQADFAVLVTTGSRRAFTGLARLDGVLVVSPLGAIPLAALLRAHIIEMLRARITKQKRAKIAMALMDYITSPQFKNPIEEVVQLSAELQQMIKDEAREHFRIWQKRWDRYQTIHWDSAQVRSNLQLVLHGRSPKPIGHAKVPQLQLPARTS